MRSASASRPGIILIAGRSLDKGILPSTPPASAASAHFSVEAQHEPQSEPSHLGPLCPPLSHSAEDFEMQMAPQDMSQVNACMLKSFGRHGQVVQL